MSRAAGVFSHNEPDLPAYSLKRSAQPDHE